MPAPFLPAHLTFGRTNYPGPVTGAPLTITFGGLGVATNQATPLLVAGIIMPFSFRLYRVTWNCVQSATANVTMDLYKHASAFQTSGATAVLSAQVDIDANETGIADAAGTTPTLSVRDLARGDRLFVALASDATGTLPQPLVVSFHGFPTGVVHADPFYD